MKNILGVIIFLMAMNLNAQEKSVPFIEVTGSAEMSVMPDQVELEIVLASSYGTKKSIDDAENHLMEVIKKHGFSAKSLNYVGTDSPFYWYYWWYSYRLNTYKTYRMSIDCNSQTMDFIRNLKPEYVQSIRIVKSTNSKITEYRRQVKIEAMKMAKEKAQDYLGCIGQNVGKVIEVVELNDAGRDNYWGYYGYNSINVTSNAVLYQPGDGEDNNSPVPVIKLRFEVKAKFEIL